MAINAVPGRIETVIAWSGGRRLHLLTRGQLSGQRQAAVEHAASRIADIDDLERAVVHILRDPFQWRIPEHVTPDVWFEVGR
jgi:hypothetical protein